MYEMVICVQTETLYYWDIHFHPSPAPFGTKSKISDHLFVYLTMDLSSLLQCFPDQVAESQNQLILSGKEGNINSQQYHQTMNSFCYRINIHDR